MSFFGLLAILSLIIILPVVFILRARKQAKLEPLPATVSPAKTLNIDKLPNLFQQIICDIEAQFFQIEQKKQQNLLLNDNYFVAKQLFFVRLPQMLEDYLKLEPNYAKNHIIDEKNVLTSYLILQQQLKTILNIFYQINQSSNQLYLQNILVNQRYLHSIAEQTGSQNIALTQHIQPSTAVIETVYDSDYDTGLQYLLNYYQNSEQGFSKKLIKKLGELVYFASITQMAVDEALGKALGKMAIKTDLELESLSYFLAYQLPIILQYPPVLHADLSHFEENLCGIFDKMLAIFSQILATLDTDLNTVDKLALVQNAHDDFAELIEQNFQIFSKK